MSPAQITPKILLFFFLKKKKEKEIILESNPSLPDKGEPSPPRRRAGGEGGLGGIKEHILAGDERGAVGGRSRVVAADKSLSRRLTATRPASHLNVHQAKEEHLIEEM